ncbi:hypothetical protein BCR39DRAFT_472124 [Naematelia encephala]|uniref:AMP-activated protein kinase glycogen-binding domain-containing protein n=1 Tax=Naematelia encephala TaxID=71784 RepID=A0A1Y2AR47_9TREE|nr:hypothetical protein BCR39DRAFT_472124 [Naematelia encephala]
MSAHLAKFTWGAGPQSVHVAGNFNNWSGDATPLNKLADGSFAADIPLPWGEKQAFKYVVDGDWKVREDEAKEWDAAGNMNNVYTAPHAPTSNEAESTTTAAAETTTTDVPPTSAPDVAPTTEPSTLLASSAPPAASRGEIPTLGAVSGATAAVPISAAPKTTEPTPVQIEKIAANANIGEAPTSQEQTYTEKATEIGAGLVGTLGAALGGAVAAVERATGVDITNTQPLSVEEATAKGIDVDTLEKKEGETDTVSPAGTKPSAEAVADLETKVQELKVDGEQQKDAASVSVNAPEPLPPKDEKLPNDLPAQDETTENHKTVPIPVITAVSEKDPKKDRTIANGDTTATKPVSSDPAVSAVDAKKEAETTASMPEAVTAVPITPVAPATPSKSTATPVSTTSTPASTPAKSAHTKDSSGGSDIKKKKSGFFSKVRSAFLLLPHFL